MQRVSPQRGRSCSASTVLCCFVLCAGSSLLVCRCRLVSGLSSGVGTAFPNVHNVILLGHFYVTVFQAGQAVY